MARKKQDTECGPSEPWLTSWADMMSLLLVLFIVLFAMANTDLKNFAAVAESLRVAFSGMGLRPPAGLVGDTKSVIANNTMAAAPLFFDRLPPKQRDFLRVSTEMTVLAKELNVPGEIDVNMTLEGIIISLSDELAFESGSADLRPEAKPILDSIANLLKDSDNRIRVEGNTDDVPTNSPMYPTNWDLSVARSVTIVRYLSEEDNIAPRRLMAAGNAEFNPLVPNDSRVHRKMNRRADIIIVYPSGTRRFSISVPSIVEPTATSEAGGGQ